MSVFYLLAGIHVQIPQWYKPRSQAINSGNLSNFRIIGYCQIVFQRSCTNIHIHQQSIPVYPHPCQHVPSDVFIFSGLISVNCVVLAWISMITTITEHFDISLLTIHISSMNSLLHFCWSSVHISIPCSHCLLYLLVFCRILCYSIYYFFYWGEELIHISNIFQILHCPCSIS